MTVETIIVKNWINPITGLILSENEDWVLMHEIPADYALDGYLLINKNYLRSREIESEELQKLRVLKLKKVSTKIPEGFSFSTALDMLKWSESVYGQFQFQEDIEDETYFGKMKSEQEAQFIVDFINSDGTIDTDFDVVFDVNKIHTIAFAADYFNSIRLLMLDEASNA